METNLFSKLAKDPARSFTATELATESGASPDLLGKNLPSHTPYQYFNLRESTDSWYRTHSPLPCIHRFHGKSSTIAVPSQQSHSPSRQSNGPRGNHSLVSPGSGSLWRSGSFMAVQCQERGVEDLCDDHSSDGWRNTHKGR